MSLRESVLSRIKENQKTAMVQVPEWGENLGIKVRELSLRERDQIQAISEDPEKDPAYSLVAPVVMACLDEEGGQLFQQSDIETLLDNGEGPIQRLYKKIMELSGVDLEKPEGESEAGKPSETTQGSGTTSG